MKKRKYSYSAVSINERPLLNSWSEKHTFISPIHGHQSARHITMENNPYRNPINESWHLFIHNNPPKKSKDINNIKNTL